MMNFVGQYDPLFPKFLAYLERLDEEVEAQGVHGLTSNQYFTGLSDEIGWMNQQRFNSLAQKTMENPFQSVKNMAEVLGVY